MKQGYDIPTELLGRSGRKGSIQIAGNREQCADDVIGLELVGFDERPQQLVSRGEDLFGVVAGDCRGSPDTVQAGWRRHGT